MRRLNRRELLAGAGLGATALLSGCAPATMFGRSMSALASTPRPAPQQLSDPRRPGKRLVTTWIGHASVLVQIEDAYFITDPVFTDTIGMVSQRLVEPGLTPDAVPLLDATIISHMHFDHLSLGSLDLIEDKVSRLVVPYGALDYIPDYRFDLIELGPHSPTSVGRLEITAVPVIHSGWRYGLDVLYGPPSFTGYLVRYRGVTVYFGGDTAYDTIIFHEVRERYGHIDLALLPIGPIHPRDFMKRRHTDPQEALQAFEDLSATYMMPIHYDTFVNSTDEPGEPESKLRQAMHQRGLSTDRVGILGIGQQRVWLE